MKIIRGTQDAKQAAAISTTALDTRTIRCTRCHGLATERNLADGSRAYVCACGAKYTASRL